MSARIGAIVYDLDGTLLATGANIAAAVNDARAAYDLRPLSEATCISYVGHGSRRLVERAILPDLAGGTTLDCVYDTFLGYYMAEPIRHIRPYDGVMEALAHWRDQGVPQAILTNKPHAVTELVIERLGLGHWFTHVWGQWGPLPGGGELPAKPDPAGLLAILAELDVAPGEAWMVGDSPPDVLVAHAAGARSLALSGGFTPHATLAALTPPPTVLCETFRDGFERLRDPAG